MFWVIVIVLIVVFIIMMSSASSKEKEIVKKCSDSGLNLARFKEMGSYVGGHPSKNDAIEYCNAYKNEDKIDIYNYRKFYNQEPKKLFSIEHKSIKSIDIEDATTMENKVTLGRVLLVGVFALAWRKKKKNEIAFVVINWNDGRFDHATTFSFDGKDAMQLANTARNNLISMCQ